MSDAEPTSPAPRRFDRSSLKSLATQAQATAKRHWRIGAGVVAGALVGVLVTIAVQPSPTTSREYLAVVDELAEADALAEESGETIREQRAELSELRGRETAVQRRGEGLDTREADLDAREASLEAREATVGIAEAEKEANTIYGGTHLVGTDVQPGRYRSNGGDMCYWERLRGVSGDFGDIIANGLSEGQVIVEIRASDVAFKSQGCGSWTRL